MNEEPMQLVEALKRDLRDRPEFEGAEVRDKLGAALPTRRPYDSAVAPGYMAVGDAAGHVNPTTGGGIAGAAYAGKYAGEQAVKAVSDGDVTEENLWRYNTRVMDHFGGRYAGLDVYNVLSTAVDVDDLMGLLAALPGEKLAEALYEGSTSMSFGLKLKAAIKSFGYWGTIRNFYQTKSLADELLAHYESYPTSPAAMANWTGERDAIMDRIYETTGADAKY
jgi:flavin-dependent dehydrogenase